MLRRGHCLKVKVCEVIKKNCQILIPFQSLAKYILDSIFPWQFKTLPNQTEIPRWYQPW